MNETKQLTDLDFLRAEHEQTVVENTQLRADVRETQASLAMVSEWHKMDLKVALSAGAEVARLREALESIISRGCCEMTARDALSTSADDWLEQHDAKTRLQERERYAGIAENWQPKRFDKLDWDIPAEVAAAIREAK